MDLFDLDQGLDAIATCGHVLNVHEVSNLKAGLLTLKHESKCEAVYFWGKLFGKTKDYYVAYSLERPDYEFPLKRFFYATADFLFKPLKQVNEEFVVKVMELAMDKPFSGLPETSLEKDAEDGGDGGDAEPPADDAPPKEKMTEADQLAQVVWEIDFETSAVPRGAYALDENHIFIPSPSFKGLGVTEAKSLDSYVHFRPPTDTAVLRCLARKDCHFMTNILDPLKSDLPTGCWALRQDSSGRMVTLRSLVWPGYVAFHVPGTRRFGGLYFGYGQKCRDLPFLL
jgi:radial spoke head protein 9